MPQVKSVKLTNGDIGFISLVKPTPPTSETTGLVTIENAGSPGRPAHFKTSFMLNVQLEEGGIEFSNVFHWNGVVLAETDASPYRQIEDAAARSIAPMLRAVADHLDQEIARFDQTAKERQSSLE